MKKTLIIAMTALSAGLFAQSSIQLKHVENNNAVLSPNAALYLTTGANHNTHFNIDVTNTSSSTFAYNVKRYDMTLNQDAVAYFCFGGNCYDNSVFVSPNPLTLAGGQSASNVSGTYNMLTADLDEGPAIGFSEVRYTFFNTSNTADSVQIIAYYNAANPVGIKENSKMLTSIELYPNPAKEVTSLHITSAKTAVSSLLLYNSIGEVVYKKDVLVNEGKNKIDLNLANFPSGVYFASLKTGDATISKKLIIN